MKDKPILYLIDSSMWIEYFREKKKNKSLQSIVQLRDFLSEAKYLCTIGPIITEIFQGIKLANKKEYGNTFDEFKTLLYYNIKKKVFIDAAFIYRSLRAKGITIDRTIDCIIAASAIKYNLTVFHKDEHFEIIKKYFPLKTIK